MPASPRSISHHCFLTQTLESRNIIIPGGDIRIGDERIALEPSGNFESVDDLKNMVIAVPGRKELVVFGRPRENLPGIP